MPPTRSETLPELAGEDARATIEASGSLSYCYGVLVFGISAGANFLRVRSDRGLFPGLSLRLAAGRFFFLAMRFGCYGFNASNRPQYSIAELLGETLVRQSVVEGGQRHTFDQFSSAIRAFSFLRIARLIRWNRRSAASVVCSTCSASG